MTATTGYSTRELQAAAAALTAGQFDTEQFPTGGAQARHVTWQSAGPMVRVAAANAGAGASTIALALADVASQGVPVWLVDAAGPTWSGLAGASGTELGGADRWRHGRRNDQLVIDRLDEHAATPAEVPVPRHHEPAALTVLDVGWTHRELAAHPSAWLNTTEATADVVVTRASAAAFGQAEVLLEHTELEACVLVVIGANRWSGPAFASAGHRMRQLRESDAIAFVPLLGARALTGLGPGPLPRPLTLSAQRVLDRITTITGPLQPSPSHPLKENS